MVVVAGIWEDGWNTPIKELDLWHYPLRDFAVDELAMTPISGIATNKVREFHRIEDIVEYYNLPVIICTEHGETDLADFEPSSGPAFYVSKGFSLTSDFAPPSRISDLSLYQYEEKELQLELSWTAPGGDYDYGRGESSPATKCCYEAKVFSFPVCRCLFSPT